MNNVINNPREKSGSAEERNELWSVNGGRVSELRRNVVKSESRYEDIKSRD